jgi:lipopolysaccharide exporter
MIDSNVASPSVSQRAVTGAGWIIAWRIATRNIGLLSTLALVRLLQPADFGLVALATGFINSVDALSAIGVQDALVRAPDLDRDMYDTGFSLSILRGALTAVVIAGIAWPVADFFHDHRLGVVMLALSLGTLLSAFENIGIVDFRRNLSFRKEFDMQLWSRVLGAVGTIAVATIWHSYWALVVGILIYRAARLVQSYVLSPYRPHLTTRAWRRIIGFSLWSWGQTMIYQAKERSDGIVIGRLLGTGPTGAFSVGLELGLLPTTELMEPLGRALFSGFATLHNASERLSGMFLGAVGLAIMLVLPAGVGISMIADPMVRFALGEHWLPAIPVVQIMAIGGIAAIFTQTCANLLNAIGRPHTTLYIAAVSLVIKVIALVLLVPQFGLPGAAAALVISSGVDLVLLVWLTLPRVGVSLAQLMVCMVRPALATAAMVLVLWQFGMAWTRSAGIEVVDFGEDAGIRSAIGAVCYGMVLLGLWLVAGRPEGAERFSLTMAIKVLGGRRHRV